MVGQPGQSDPDVAVEKLLACWSGMGVVVNAGALDAGTIASGGRIIDGEQEVVAGSLSHERLESAAEQAAGQVGGASSGGPEGVVGRSEVGSDGGGTEPAGDGASPLGEEGSEEESEQSWGGASVEGGAEVSKAGGQQGGQSR